MSCQNCELYKNSKTVCMKGEGPSNARAMFVGEAPGQEEDIYGRPFVGRSGKLLDELLVKTGLKREEIFVTNAVRCFPISMGTISKNRAPSAKEVTACFPYLEQEIISIKPKLIVCLGNIAGKSLLKEKDLSSYKNCFTFNEKYNCHILVTSHPAVIFRQPQFEQILLSDLVKVKGFLEGKEVIVSKDLQYIIVEDKLVLDEAVKRLCEVEEFSFDLETTGFNPLKDSIICMSFSWKEGTGICIPLLNPDKTLKWDDYDWMKTIFESKAKKIGHNLSFDLSFLLVNKIEPANIYADSLLMHFLLDENSFHNLKTLACLYTDMGGYEKELDKYKMGYKKKDFSFIDIPFNVLFPYAIADADCTYRLYKLFKPKIEKEKLDFVLYNILMPLQNVITRTELRGVQINKKYGLELLKTYEIQIQNSLNVFKQSILKLLYQLYPEGKIEIARVKSKVKKNELSETTIRLDEYIKELNINSSTQLGDLLFKKLKLTSLFTTKTGKLSTDAACIHSLSINNPAVKDLLEYRKKWKKKTCVEGILNGLDENNRVHTSYMLHGEVTGRISSKEPNLQNVNKDPEIFNLFIASSGFKLIVADYNQIELRVLAVYTQDKKLLEAYEKGEDLHKKTAQNIFNVTDEQVTDRMRKVAKQINFGLVYGRGPMSLAEQLGCSIEVATEYINTYFAKYPAVKNWISNMNQKIYNSDYIVNWFGRKRRFLNISRATKRELGEMERQSQNFPIQGTAADITSMATVRIYKRFKQEGIKGYLILTIHDALIYEVLEKDFEPALIIIKEEMERPIPNMNIRFPIEIKTGYAWGDCKKEGGGK